MPEHSVIKPHGIVTVTDVDGRTIERDTLRCVHCQKVWTVVPGSGRRRGFCTRCMGPTCGDPRCEQGGQGGCMNFEQKLELYEKGKIDRLS